MRLYLFRQWCYFIREPAGRAHLDLVPRIMEDRMPEVLLDALEKHYRRAADGAVECVDLVKPD